MTNAAATLNSTSNLVDARVNAAVQKLSANLENGQSAEFVAYLKTMAHFHRYSFRNVVLILSQRPDATRVAGRYTWRQLKRAVSAKAIGIEIRVPILPQWAYKLPSYKKVFIPCTEFRPGNVFEVADTSGDPLPERPSAAGNPEPYLGLLKRAISEANIALRYVHDLGGPEGTSYGGLIELRQGFVPAHEFSVLVHEYAHELLHTRRQMPRRKKKVVETEAEAVAFIVCHATGLETGSFSSDYIALYNGDIGTLRRSLARIQGTARQILSEVGFDEFACAAQS